MTTWITLPPHTLDEATAEGTQRRTTSITRGRHSTYGLGRNEDLNLAVSIQGRLAEIALSTALGIPSEPATDRPYYGGDVGEYEVRSTHHQDGHLILHPDDPDDRICYLVITASPRFGIVGSIRIGDGKQDYFWNAKHRHPAYFIPQTALDPYRHNYVPCGICPGVMIPGYPPPHPWCAFGGWKPGDRIYGPTEGER